MWRASPQVRHDLPSGLSGDGSIYCLSCRNGPVLSHGHTGHSYSCCHVRDSRAPTGRLRNRDEVNPCADVELPGFAPFSHEVSSGWPDNVVTTEHGTVAPGNRQSFGGFPGEVFDVSVGMWEPPSCRDFLGPVTVLSWLLSGAKP